MLLKVIWKLTKIHNKNYAIIKNAIFNDKLQYYCPCCKKYLSKFTRGGFIYYSDTYNPKRYEIEDSEVICPICYSLPRHRIIVEWLGDNINLIRGKKILHFAQERQIKKWMDENNIEYTTADLYRPADLRINIENTGLEDESYDVVICNHVLEHVDDWRKALMELNRILKKGGMIILSFPVDLTYETVDEDPNVVSDADRLKKYGQADHKRVFGRDSKELLENIGFKVEEIAGENFSERIKPVIGPADYDYNRFWCLISDNSN